MIAYFPVIYPDELLYSVVSRFYVKSGYENNSIAAKVIYKNPKALPDKEFCNTYTSELLKLLTRDLSKEEIILKHTMFSYYYRFYSPQQRKQIFEYLVSFVERYSVNNRTRHKGQEYLRYCPACVENDRKVFGETYWHRLHQISDINICPVHNCLLINSDVFIAKKSYLLFTAEEHIKTYDIIYCENQTKRKLAQYLKNVFLSNINLKSNEKFSSYFGIKVNGGYSSDYIVCKALDVFVPFAELLNYYNELEDKTFVTPSITQLKLNNCRLNTYEVCMLAMFLNITPENLAII